MIRWLFMLTSLACCLCEASHERFNGSHLARSPRDRGCQMLGTCSQVCQESSSGPECSCYEGYLVDLNDPRRCKASRGTAVLFYSDASNVEQVDVSSGEVRNLVSKHNARIAALDYHYTQRVLYWADLFREGIYRTSLASGETFWAAVVGGRDSEPVSPAGLAVDWIYNRIYWTDLLRGVIELANLDGSHRTSLLAGEVHSPADIALYPPEGWMFWTCRGTRPQLERAGMDGSQRQVLVWTEVRLPMGLALDLVQRRVFWADQEAQLVASCLWDGSQRTVVLRGSSILPAFLAVFEDTVYWSDWGWKAVMAADKFTGTKQTSLTTDKSSVSLSLPPFNLFCHAASVVGGKRFGNVTGVAFEPTVLRCMYKSSC